MRVTAWRSRPGWNLARGHGRRPKLLTIPHPRLCRGSEPPRLAPSTAQLSQVTIPRSRPRSTIPESVHRMRPSGLPSQFWPSSRRAPPQSPPDHRRRSRQLPNPGQSQSQSQGTAPRASIRACFVRPMVRRSSRPSLPVCPHLVKGGWVGRRGATTLSLSRLHRLVALADQSVARGRGCGGIATTTDWPAASQGPAETGHASRLPYAPWHGAECTGRLPGRHLAHGQGLRDPGRTRFSLEEKATKADILRASRDCL